jgi:intracellular septation protein
MNVFFDLIPAIAFFIAYKMAGIYIATIVLIVMSILQFGYTLIRYRRIDFLQAMICLLVLVFGSATVLLHDSEFLQWKVSVASWLMGVAFWATGRFTQTPLIQRMLKDSIELTPPVWKRLNRWWACYFLTLGVLNLIVAKLFSLNAWVDFKVFGIFGLTVLFVIAQGVYLQKHLKS